MQRVIGITKDKYIDTDLDTLLIHFSDTKQESYVYEYDVPEEFPYIIFQTKLLKPHLPDVQPKHIYLYLLCLMSKISRPDILLDTPL